MTWLLPALLASQVSGIWLADRLVLGADQALRLGLLALAGGLASARVPALRAALALLLGLAAGALALATRLEAARQARPGAPVVATVEGRVASLRIWPGGGSVVLHHVQTVAGPPVPPALQILVSRGEGKALLERPPGSWIRARLRVKAPRALRNPGGWSRARRLARAGIGGVGRLLHPRLQTGLGALPRGRGWLQHLRRRIARRLEAQGAGGAFLAALAVGEPGGLSRQVRASLARLGLAHLLAVSGLHLALVAALVLWVARPSLAWALRRRPLADARRAALWAAFLAATAYAVITGLGIPVRRALVFLGAWGVVASRGRPTRRAAPLLLAALLVLAADPGALFALGAQLSFVATGALLWSREEATDGGSGSLRSRMGRHARGLLRASASAAAATAPLLAWSGRSVAVLGGVANLVAVPLTALLLLPLALLCAAALALAPGAATPFVALASRLAGALLAGALALASRLPASPPAPPASTALAGSVLLAVLAIRARSTAFRVALAVLAGLAPGALPPPAIAPAAPRVVFLDVGQGDAALVQTRYAVLLVDGGTAIPGGVDLGERIVVPALRALGVRRIDLLVASHADLDHRGGLPAVLRSVPVGRIWLPPHERADRAFAALLSEARRLGIPVEERGAGGAPFRRQDLAVVPLWPPRRAGPVASDNDASLALRIDLPGARVLLPGDIEAAGERALVLRGADVRADVLKLAHHGSRTSSTAAFLDAVHPRVAVASAPPAGRFGMPDPTVRARLARRHIALAWTGRDGAILIGLERALSLRRFSVDRAPAPLRVRTGDRAGGGAPGGILDCDAPAAGPAGALPAGVGDGSAPPAARRPPRRLASMPAPLAVAAPPAMVQAAPAPPEDRLP